MKSLFIVFLLMTIPLPGIAGERVAQLTRKQGPAEVEAPRLRHLVQGDGVLDQEVVHTGTDARLLFDMIDGTQITLGANSRFRFDAADLEDQPATLQLLTGAFRLATNNKRIDVITPLGTIGIRGTDFWGGFLDPDDFGVFLFSGKAITVTNDYGQVQLSPGQGTNLKAGQAPSAPGEWGAQRLEKAIQTVRFGP